MKMFATKSYIFRGSLEQQVEQQKSLHLFGEMGIAVTNVKRHPDYMSFTLSTISDMFKSIDVSAYEELKLGSQEWKNEFEFPEEMLFRLHAVDKIDDDDRYDVIDMLEHMIGHRVRLKDVDTYAWPRPKETRNDFRKRMRESLTLNNSNEFFHKGKKYIFVVIDEMPRPFLDMDR